MTKIYTRTGDKGDTSLFTGQRVSKDDPFIAAMGKLDECNSAIGLSLSFFGNDDKLSKIKNQLEIIQHALFDVGAAIATPRTKAIDSKLNMTRFDKEAIEILEKWMDEMEKMLPQLHAFILPGGSPAASHLHLARSICRGAERQVIPLFKQGDVSENVLIYLNRLSDYLFMAARSVNHMLNVKETLWDHHKVPKL